MKRLAIALALGTAVFAAVFAAAATLGLSADQLGAGDRAVSSCDNEINVDYDTVYDASLESTEPGALGRYEITTVNLEGLNTTACAGQKINLILTDSNGAILPAPSGTPDADVGAATKVFTCCTPGSGAGGVLTIAELDIDPRLVYSVHVLITGVSNTAADTAPQTGNP